MRIQVKVLCKRLSCVHWRLNMPDFLVFQLYGNLSSWGDIAVGNNRPIQPYPSKSAISGLLAASLGIRREDDKAHLKLDTHYGVAVCVQSQGELLRDYHTIQVPAGTKNWFTRKDELCFDRLGLKTILSQRDYQMDAFYLVAIWIKEDDKENAPYSLNQLATSLQNPVFITSLGRKSCPPCLPYNPKIFNDSTLKEACENYQVPDELSNHLRTKELIAWHWEDLPEKHAGMKYTMVYPRRDQVRSRKRWQFSMRNEYYYAEKALKKGGDNVL